MRKRMRKRDKQRVFTGTLASKGPRGALTFLSIPFSVEKVSGTLNGFPFRNSLMPEGDGTHSMMVGKQLQVGAKANPGDQVNIVMQLDEAERVVEVPPELNRALEADVAMSQQSRRSMP
jgi:hypothetical protein